MKVLFATHDGADFLASGLWDGFQELLGAENVHDAGNNGGFKGEASGFAPSEAICGMRRGFRSCDFHGIKYDLLVLNACFLQQHDWHGAWNLRERLAPGGKVAYCEGGDSAYDVNDPMTRSNPPFPVDAVFRREIDQGHVYPYRCYHLDFAAPRRWFERTLQRRQRRTIDVMFAGGPGSNPVRWDMMKHLFNGGKTYTFVYSQQADVYNFTPEEHLNLLRKSKLALCPPGGSNCASTMRLFETLAAGAIPVFVECPPRYRSPEITAAWCYNRTVLSDVIEAALDSFTDKKRQEILEYNLENHTTAARAKKLLEMVGLS